MIHEARINSEWDGVFALPKKKTTGNRQIKRHSRTQYLTESIGIGRGHQPKGQQRCGQQQAQEVAYYGKRRIRGGDLPLRSTDQGGLFLSPFGVLVLGAADKRLFLLVQRRPLPSGGPLLKGPLR